MEGDADLVDFLLQGVKLLELDALGGSGSRGYGRVRFEFTDESLQQKYNAVLPLWLRRSGSRGYIMKIYGITIQPLSPFGTLLKGDTLFGHFCWQAAEDGALLAGGLDKWIDCYASESFCGVFFCLAKC